MKKHTLKAEQRLLTGRKVKRLRQQGTLPATVYGKNVKSQSLTVSQEEFETVYEQAGETGLIELTVEGKTRPVLVHSVQRHAVKGNPLHVEFHQVDLKEKVKADIPIVAEGIAPAVEQKLGIFIQVLNELGVEALPTDLPEHISVDISGLMNVNDELKVKDLHVPAAVTVLSDSDLSVMRIAPLAKEEPIAPPPTEAAAEGEAQPEAAAEEGAPAAGEEAGKPEQAAEKG